MVPSTYRALLAQLLSELSSCYSLCDDIRTNRRLGRTHHALDNLQDNFRISINNLQLQFNTLRRIVGPTLDVGDDVSKDIVAAALRDVNDYIRARLFGIAFRYYQVVERPVGALEAPHFREILRRWHHIEVNVTSALDALSTRLTTPIDPPKPDPVPEPEPVPEPTPAPDPYFPRREEVIISLQDLDHLVDHMKNSWVENLVGSDLLYVNAFDRRRWTWERPNTGYIKEIESAPKRKTVKRRVSWERTSKKPRPT